MDQDPDELAFQRRLEMVARARQAVRRVDAYLARSRAERVLAEVAERQRRDHQTVVFKVRTDLRPNHLTDPERRKIEGTLVRWHESKERAYRALGWRRQSQNNLIYRAAINELKNNRDGFHFVLSDATPDRYGDVIHQDGWDLTNFRNNPVALFSHNKDFIIGAWGDVKVEHDKLCGRLNLAPEGLSKRVDEIRQLVEAGILRAVSVGFHPIEQTARVGSKSGGRLYLKAELLEASLVSIPANPNALSLAKKLNISDATMKMVTYHG